MSLFELYLILVVLPGLDGAFVAAGVLMTIATIAVGFVGGFAATLEGMWEDEDFVKGVKKYVPKWLIGLAVVVLLAVATPDEGELQKIIGGYVVTNVEGIEQLPENLVEYANKFLEGESEGGEE